MENDNCPSLQAFRAIVEVRGLSLGRLSQALGVDKSHVSRVLGGKARPSLALASRIERVYGVSVGGWHTCA